MSVLWTQTIYGEPASKANSRRIVYTRGRVRSIKSRKAIGYVAAFCAQAAKLAVPITCDVVLTVRIWYASRRPDLDVALIMDCLQRAGIIKNDRQVVEIHAYKYLQGLLESVPSAEIELTEAKPF